MVQTSAKPSDGSRPSRRRTWERATGIPMLVLAVLFICVYAWHVLDTGKSPRLDAWLERVDIMIWAAFAADFAIRTWLSSDRWRFVRAHPLELLVVLLPPFRPVRLLRAALLVLDQLNRNQVTRARLAIFVGTSSALTLVLCSLAFFDAEYGAPGSKIHNFGDALWWSMVSVTTVGYGDVYPVTVHGRLIALILMTLGIGLISFAIGATTSWVMAQLKAVEVTADRTEGEITVLIDEIRALRHEVAEFRAASKSGLTQFAEATGDFEGDGSAATPSWATMASVENLRFCEPDDSVEPNTDGCIEDSNRPSQGPTDQSIPAMASGSTDLT